MSLDVLKRCFRFQYFIRINFYNLAISRYYQRAIFLFFKLNEFKLNNIQAP
jgi:hypothetical protein